MKDLTTEQGRKAAINELENSFITELRGIGVELADDVMCVLGSNIASIGFVADKRNFVLGLTMNDYSLIDLITSSHGNKMDLPRANGFERNREQHIWRFTHAASILKNWDKVCKLVNTYCKAYRELAEEIKEVNKVK